MLSNDGAKCDGGVLQGYAFNSLVACCIRWRPTAFLAFILLFFGARGINYQCLDLYEHLPTSTKHPLQQRSIESTMEETFDGWLPTRIRFLVALGDTEAV